MHYYSKSCTIYLENTLLLPEDITLDYQRFLEAYEKIAFVHRERDGIGTLSEKTLHAVLKHYFEPKTENQEVKIGSYYADIYTEEGIIEIQTKQFNKLRNKLKAFLPEYSVTLVYPIAYEKHLFWINQETGEVSKGRRSPKKGSHYDIFKELYKIKEFLKHENLKIIIMMVNMDEYRYLNGWSRDKKKGSYCCDRIPTSIVEEIQLYGKKDYKKMVPEELDSKFTSKEFAKAGHIRRNVAQVVLNILYEIGAVERVGKEGNSYIYSKI